MREWAVALTGGLTLAFTAWGFAGVVVWSLHTMLIGGLLTLTLAVAPLSAKFNGRDGAHGNQKNFKRLLKAPFFWFSLFFLLYLVLQAVNPAATVVRDARGWWVEGIETPLGTWLPTSVRSDYEPMNAWRVLVSFSAAFSLMWGLWIGVTRRKVALLMLWCFLLSGSGMAFVAILQHLSGAEKVLWTMQSSNPEFWGSFFYRNQGAAYLNLILVAAGFLYFYHAKNSHERARIGGPHFLCFLLFALVATSVGLALSRGGILFGTGIAIAFLLGSILQYLLSAHSVSRSLTVSMLAGVLLFGGAGMLAQQIDWNAIQKRFGDVEATIENAQTDVRAFSTKATWDMAQDRLLLGWGAGSFRYIFPMYQRAYPEIYYHYRHRSMGWVGRSTYRYAHNDIVQFLAEYGAVGCGLLVATLVCFLWVVLRGLTVNVFSALILLFGCGSAFAHAFLDFIFNSPAYWVAFVGFLTLSAKLLGLERQRRRSRRSAEAISAKKGASQPQLAAARPTVEGIESPMLPSVAKAGAAVQN